jgi:hypothetical protein
MNETKLQKHFANQYKNNGRIIICRLDNGVIGISDVSMMAFVRDNSIVIDSRKVFPRIPETGESFGFISGKESLAPKDMQGFVNNIINNPNLKRFETTLWKYNDSSMLEASLDGERIFVNPEYLDLLLTKNNDLQSFAFFAASSKSPIIVKRGHDELVMIVMPLNQDEDSANTVLKVG